MKSHIILITSVLLALTSCGTTASFTQATGQQKYQDGIYYRPQSLTLADQAARLSETEDLIAQTKSSAVFVKTIGQVDTLLIPDNMSATFKFNHKDSTTTISLYDDYDLMDDWMWNHSAWYRYNSFWGPSWGFNFRHSLFYYDPFYGPAWHGMAFYDPFWYDPFWYDPWYSSIWDPIWWGYPWHYGFGYYDPFYGPFGPYTLAYYYPAVYNNRYDHYGYGNVSGRGITTRSDNSLIKAQPRAGVGRVVRTAGNAAADDAVAKKAAGTRLAVAPRNESTAARSNAARVSRQPGTAAGNGTPGSAGAGVVRSSSSNVSRSGETSSATGAYRRSTTSYGSTGNASRASGSTGGSYSRSSSSSYSGGSSYSGSSSSSVSRSAGSYSGGSSSSVSRSSGGYSGGSSSGSVSRGSGGGGRR